MTSVVSPNVQIIAMPVPFSGSASWCASDRHLDAEQRRAHLGAEQRLVALVVGMGDQRDARGEQLGPRRLDQRRRRRRRPGGSAARGTRPAARGPRARPARPRCGSRRPTASAPRPGTPRRARGCAGTRAATRAPRRVADRRVGERPVDRQAEPAPQLLELLLVLDDEPRRTARRSSGGEIGIALLAAASRAARTPGSYGSVRVAAHAVVVLHAPLGGQPVVVPAHRVEDLAARACAGSGRWCRSACSRTREPMCSEPLTVGGGVSIEKISARARDAVEAVGAVGLPDRRPARLEPVERRLVGDAGHAPDCRRHLRAGPARHRRISSHHEPVTVPCS